MPSKRPEVMQQRLKSASGATRAEVVAPEFLGELDVAVNDTVATPDLSF
jgi:hypothetical protein